MSTGTILLWKIVIINVSIRFNIEYQIRSVFNYNTSILMNQRKNSPFFQKRNN